VVWFHKLDQLCGSNTDTSAQEVVSATPTQLRVRIPYFDLPLTGQHPQNCRRGSVRLNVASRSTESVPITFLVPPRLSRWTSADGTTIARGSTPVTIPVRGIDEDESLNVLTVNGVTIPPASRTQSGPNRGTGLGTITFTMPDAASPGGGSSFTDIADVRVALSVRGRTADSMMTMRRYPPMRLDSIRSELVPQGTPGAPDTRQLTLFVRNYFGPAVHRWRRFGTTSPTFQDALPMGADTTANGLYSGPIVISPPDGVTTGSWDVILRFDRFGVGNIITQLPNTYGVP